jgi:cytochrome P450
MDTTASPETAAPTLGFNPASADFKRDPYPYYERLRAEAPVHLSAFGFWTVARYDDVTHVLKTPHVFSSAGMGAASMIGDAKVRSVISSDPPRHTQMRNLVNRAFTPRMVADLEPRIREIARELIDAVAASGEMDLVRDLAMPLPVIVISQILGVDPSRRDDFKRWSNAIVSQFQEADEETRQRMGRDREEFLAYFREQIDERRAHPKDDLISAIVAAEDAEVALTPDEVAGFAMLLLVAGNETTTNLIGNATLALTQHPDQMRRVADDPSLIPNMVEETLRYDAPVQFLIRTTTQETRIAGQTIPAGNTVAPIFASANRDDARYPDGARFDITRNAQGHLAFGLGPHFCLGAPLARLEAKVAFEELLSRTRRITLTNGAPPVRIDSMILRGLSSLPLTFDPAD